MSPAKLSPVSSSLVFTYLLIPQMHITPRPGGLMVLLGFTDQAQAPHPDMQACWDRSHPRPLNFPHKCHSLFKSLLLCSCQCLPLGCPSHCSLAMEVAMPLGPLDKLIYYHCSDRTTKWLAPLQVDLVEPTRLYKGLKVWQEHTFFSTGPDLRVESIHNELEAPV